MILTQQRGTPLGRVRSGQSTSTAGSDNVSGGKQPLDLTKSLLLESTEPSLPDPIASSNDFEQSPAIDLMALALHEDSRTPSTVTHAR